MTTHKTQLVVLGLQGRTDLTDVHEFECQRGHFVYAGSFRLPIDSDTSADFAEKVKQHGAQCDATMYQYDDVPLSSTTTYQYDRVIFAILPSDPAWRAFEYIAQRRHRI
jgi:hypothetical protein